METGAMLAIIPAVIAAMGGVLKLVLSALDRIETRQERFLGNHMSGNTKALTDLAKAIENHTAKSELEWYRLRTALEKTGHHIPEADSSEE